VRVSEAVVTVVERRLNCMELTAPSCFAGRRGIPGLPIAPMMSLRNGRSGKMCAKSAISAISLRSSVPKAGLSKDAVPLSPLFYQDDQILYFPAPFSVGCDLLKKERPMSDKRGKVRVDPGFRCET
jgi:hypothetical protein